MTTCVRSAAISTDLRPDLTEIPGNPGQSIEAASICVIGIYVVDQVNNVTENAFFICRKPPLSLKPALDPSSPSKKPDCQKNLLISASLFINADANRREKKLQPPVGT